MFPDASRAEDVATRAGHVAIIGLPNAGKSSLLNRLLETKLSIVSRLPQTTRERVVGIDSRDGVQAVFLDTPGLVEPAYLLHRAMIGIAEQAIADADVVVLLLDGSRPPPKLDAALLDGLRAKRGGLLCAVNKVDVAADTQVDELAGWSSAELGVSAIRISAQTGEGVEALREEIHSRLPLSPFLYPDDELSTQSVRFFVSELIREAVFELFEDEVPFSVATRVEEYRENADPVYIRAVVYVERPSQKAILIGERGSAIRRLGTLAREKVERFVGGRVYLDLWVKVLPRWRKNPIELARLGFPVPDPSRDDARRTAP